MFKMNELVISGTGCNYLLIDAGGFRRSVSGGHLFQLCAGAIQVDPTGAGPLHRAAALRRRQRQPRRQSGTATLHEGHTQGIPLIDIELRPKNDH